MPHSWGVGVVGLGKIAQDQHVPVIEAHPDFHLVAVSSQRGLAVRGACAVRDHADLLAMADVDVVVICTPPQVRHAIARDALSAGKHVMLEKPPTATISELSDLVRRAEAAGQVLMTTWHSQHNAAVDEAKRLLAGQVVSRLAVSWKEDVRKWHPGQSWIFEPGGFGVFDPGVNALSIVTKIMPQPVFLRGADLVFPQNAGAPIAATLRFDGPDHRAEFDWRQEGGEIWEVNVETEGGARLTLAEGGTRLLVDGALRVAAAPAEYQSIYTRFAELLQIGQCEIDEAPFRLVADAFLLGRRQETTAFEP